MADNITDLTPLEGLVLWNNGVNFTEVDPAVDGSGNQSQSFTQNGDGSYTVNDFLFFTDSNAKTPWEHIHIDENNEIELISSKGVNTGFTLTILAHSQEFLLVQMSPNGAGITNYYLLRTGNPFDDPNLDASNMVIGPNVPGGRYEVARHLNLTLSEDNPTAPFGLVPGGDEPCFAEGVQVRTTRGDVAVEELAEGDLVITASGAERPVKWIGRVVARPARHPRPHQVNPVRIKAGAFAEGLPARDLRLSPGHAVYVDGVLVPVGHLVNGATIVQEDVEQVRYFHVELDSHDVLLAEGLPCESYLDDGNRSSFANAGEFTNLHGRLDPKSWADACAPVVAGGPQLVDIQQRLHARAEELGWVRTENARLAVVADGAEIAPKHSSGNRYWFAVPAATEVVLRSSSGVLAQVMPGLGDGRRLGVAVSAVRLDGEAIALDADVFGAGFYLAEKHEPHNWRWTNGEATLKLAVKTPAMLEVELVMVAPSWVRPRPALRVVA